MTLNFLAQAKQWSEDLKKAVSRNRDPLRDLALTEATAEAPEIDTSSSWGPALLGPVVTPSEPWFPDDLIGGCCPRVPGEERELIWNAAAEAADSERVQVVWQAQGDKIWYLAARSADMASHPQTWCPFAALLPGMQDAASLPACYMYYSDETAVMMTVAADSLHIHRGTAAVIRAKAERTSREMGGAAVIELGPERIEALIPVPWLSLSLFEDRARRILSAAVVGSGLAVAAVALIVWVITAMALLKTSIDKNAIQARTQQKSVELLQVVQGIRASPMREQLAKFAELNDGLLSLNGLLEVYRVKGPKTLWRAVVPANVTSDRIDEMGGQTLDTNAQGVVIGNTREALTMDGKP